jgi:hypothetical protein
MSSTGRYLKPGVRASAPGVLFTIIVNPNISPGDETGRMKFHTFNSAAVAVAHRDRGGWTRQREAFVEDPAELWEWMKEHADPHKRNYVFAPSVPECLSITRFWETVDPADVWFQPQHAGAAKKPNRKTCPNLMTVRRCVLNPRVGMFDYSQFGLSWVWLSAHQYLGHDEESIAKSMGFRWPVTQDWEYDGPTPIRTAPERAAMWRHAFVEMSKWWMASSRAPWGMTASAMSMGMLRTHIQPKSISTHTHADTHRLERDACFGGRASVWFYGDVGFPVAFGNPNLPAPKPAPYPRIEAPAYNLDVRSMYPWLLRERDYPCFRTSYREDCRPTDPQEYAESFGVVARVEIETRRAEYPERVNDRIYYRVGRFTTTLTGPELLALREDGRVVRCHAMATYQMGRPFREAARSLIAMREEARREKRPAWELFAKTLAVGMGGKLAQRKGAWEHVADKCPPYAWGEWMESRSGNKAPAKYRAIAGMCWKYMPDGTGMGPYTAAFAYLAAYGRIHMRTIRDQLPAKSVLSQDTDGLWVTAAGRDAAELAQSSCEGRAGELTVRKAVSAGRWFGPKHYFTSDGWVLSGFAEPRIDADGQSVADTVRADNHLSRSHTSPKGVSVYRVVKSLRVESHGMKIGADGWASETRRS